MSKEGGILILGIMIIGFTYGISSSFTSQQQSLLSVVGTGCNSFLGTIGSALSSTIAYDCQQINTINAILNLVPFAYLIGGGLFLGGLLSLVKKSKKINNKPKPEEKKENEEKIEDDAIKTLKIRYAKGEITKDQFDTMKKELE